MEAYLQGSEAFFEVLSRMSSSAFSRPIRLRNSVTVNSSTEICVGFSSSQTCQEPPPPHDMTQNDSGTITNLTSILQNLSSFTLNSQKMAIPPLLEGHDSDALETAMGPKEQTHRGAKPSDQFPDMTPLDMDDFPSEFGNTTWGCQKSRRPKCFFNFFRVPHVTGMNQRSNERTVKDLS